MASKTNITIFENNFGIENARQLVDCGLWKYLPNIGKIWLSEKVYELFDVKSKEEFINIDELRKFTNNDDLFKIFTVNFLDQTHLSEGQIEVKINIEKANYKSNKYILIKYRKDQKDDQVTLSGIIRDISQQKKYEDELNKAKEKLEEADKLKSAFLSNISHEIRTPMNSILGFVELIILGGLDEVKRESFLKIIKNKSKHLLSYIDDVIEFNKLEYGEAGVNNTSTNIVKLLAELFNEINKEKLLFNKTGVEIFLNIPPNSGDYSEINIDSGRLQQILKILLDNALASTEKGYIQIGFELKDNKHLMFIIKDTGNGYSKEEIKNIFNTQKILDTNIKSKISGNISFLIVKRIVEIMGGKIHVDSTQNEGTTFTIVIPFGMLDKTIVNEEETNIFKKYNWKDKLVLIAEDEEDNFRFLEAVLDDTKAKLIHVSNGQQAVEIFKSINNIDLILMDIRMPEMNGYDAIREIKRLKPNVPIIAQTAFALKDEHKKCIEAGCDDYISKPIEIELLLNKMSQYLT